MTILSSTAAINSPTTATVNCPDESCPSIAAWTNPYPTDKDESEAKWACWGSRK